MTFVFGNSAPPGAPHRRHRPGGAASRWLVALLAAGLLVLPLFFATIPPLMDYPNHLARIYVLAFAAHDPVLSRIYAAQWSIIPDLGIDIVMPPMLKIMPVYLAGRVMLGAVLLLPVAGAAVYSRVAFGRFSFWPLGAGLVSYGAAFIAGYMNFQLSIGLALLAASLWLAWGDRRPLAITPAAAACAVIVFFCHIFGLVFLAVLISSHELAALLKQRDTGRPFWRHAVWRAGWRSARLVGVFGLPAILYGLTQLHAARTGPLYIHPLPLWFAAKVAMLAAPFWGYRLSLSIVTLLVVVALLYVLIRERALKAAAGSGVALVALLALYLALPLAVKGATYPDGRVAILVGFLLFAGFTPELRPRAELAAAGVLTALLLAQIASTTIVWHDYNRIVAAFEATIAPVAPGARVLAVRAPFDRDPAYWHTLPAGHVVAALGPLDVQLPALLVIERKAFWPLLFADPTQHPVRVRAPFAELAGKGWPPTYRALFGRRVTPGHPPPAYLKNWQKNFDYVLLLDPGAAEDLQNRLPDRLRLVRRSSIAALYRIRRAVPSATASPSPG